MRKTPKLSALGVLTLAALLSVDVPRARADVAVSIGIPFPGIAFYAPAPPPVYYPPPAYYPPAYYYGPPRYYAPAYGSVYFGGGHGWGHHHKHGGGHRGGHHRAHRW